MVMNASRGKLTSLYARGWQVGDEATEWRSPLFAGLFDRCDSQDPAAVLKASRGVARDAFKLRGTEETELPHPYNSKGGAPPLITAR